LPAIGPRTSIDGAVGVREESEHATATTTVRVVTTAAAVVVRTENLFLSYAK
jgi:hypothetical protein